MGICGDDDDTYVDITKPDFTFDGGVFYPKEEKRIITIENIEDAIGMILLAVAIVCLVVIGLCFP